MLRWLVVFFNHLGSDRCKVSVCLLFLVHLFIRGVPNNPTPVSPSNLSQLILFLLDDWLLLNHHIRIALFLIRVARA